MTPPSFIDGTSIAIEIPPRVAAPSRLRPGDILPPAQEPLQRFTSLPDILSGDVWSPDDPAKAAMAVAKSMVKSSYTQVALSLCIIGFVTATTCVLGGLILYAGIIDSHANVRVVAALMRGNAVSQTSVAAAAPALLLVDPSDADAAAMLPAGCDTVSSDSGASSSSPRQNFSLIDFLRVHNLPNSFEDRLELARKYGVVDYSGTSLQNRHLLSILQQELFLQCHHPDAGSV